MSADKVYARVTEQVLAALEGGTIPWRKPWTDRGEGMAKNLASRRPYRGINQLLLQLSEYSEPWWTTFRGAKKLGGSVKKGEHGSLVVFWKKLMVDDSDHPGEKKAIPLFRHYTVFNVEQTEGIEYPAAVVWDDEEEFDPIAEAEEIVQNYENPPKLVHGGDQAFYSPEQDLVKMPKREQFHDAEGYYAALFHESAHSTGHPDRLDRKQGMATIGQPKHDYAEEELVAEIGAAMLCGLAGIAPAAVENAAAYIQTWMRALDDDPKMVVKAAGQAQRAADWITGTEPPDYDDNKESK